MNFSFHTIRVKGKKPLKIVDKKDAMEDFRTYRKIWENLCK